MGSEVSAGVSRAAAHDEPGESRVKDSNTLQTLDRGLQTLAIVSLEPEGLSVADLAERLEVHRAVAYRLVATLESHGLIARRTDGQLHLGPGILTLASRFEAQLRMIAQPLVRELAAEVQAAAFLSVPEDDDCVPILVAEPEGAVLRIAYRVGSRHKLTVGAAGIAILAGRAPQPNEPEGVRKARKLGYSVTRSEIQRGAVGVASPVHDGTLDPLGLEASVGVVALDDLDTAQVSAAVMSCAQKLASAIRAGVAPKSKTRRRR